MNTTSFHFLDIIHKWRKTVYITFFTACVISVIVSLIIPKWYKARATVVPPTQSSMMGLSALMGSLPLASFGMSGMNNETTTFLAVLKSTSVRKKIINQYGLVKLYKAKNIDWALRDLDDNLSIDLTDEGIIEIEFLDKSPQQAADVVNSLIEELDRKNIIMKVEQAKNNRIFIEKRLDENKKDLKTAEDNLKEFQETHNAISLPDQVTALIGEIARLKSEEVSLEIRRNVLEQTSNINTLAVKTINTQLHELQRQLRRMESGADRKIRQSLSGSQGREIYIPFGKIPEVGLEFARLTRELKIQETIFELLIQQYEQAKIQEVKDTPTVQILDKAVPPLIKAKPKRAFFVLFWSFLALFVCIFSIYLAEYLACLKESTPGRYGKIIDLLKVNLKKD